METRFGGCRPNFFQLLVGHTKQPAFAIVPGLVPVQLHEQHPGPTLSPRDAEVLQLLIHVVRYAEVVLEMCNGDRLLLVFCILHRLF